MAYAVETWITAHDGRRVKIGIPVGMRLGDVEDQLHERYWTPPKPEAITPKEGQADERLD